MRLFNTPPEWPDPPTTRWRPPRRWRPHTSWPPAPAGWHFWVDQRGKAVSGPVGRYGGVSPARLAALTLLPAAMIAALLFFNPFSSQTVDTGTVPAPATVKTTAAAPATEPPTTTRPTEKPTRQIEQTPTSTPAAVPSDTPGTPSTPSPSATPQSTTVVVPTPTVEPTQVPVPSKTPTSASVQVVYSNCAEVRAAGKAPLHRGDPGYSEELDRNGDGVACERGNS